MANSIQLGKLRDKFPEVDIEWRLGRSGIRQDGEIWATCLAYITNRAIQERLDSVCGPENWRNEYREGPQGGVLCGLSIRVDGEWITKWDGADNTKFESVKGGLSDSMKRAAVQWGIGRYLYDLDEGFAEPVAKGTPGARYAKVEGRSFYWLAPKLPSWALPDGGPTTAAPAAPAKKSSTKSQRSTRASDEELARIKNLCEQTETDQKRLYEHFEVKDTPTAPVAKRIIASLEKKLARRAYAAQN